MLDAAERGVARCEQHKMFSRDLETLRDNIQGLRANKTVQRTGARVQIRPGPWLFQELAAAHHPSANREAIEETIAGESRTRVSPVRGRRDACPTIRRDRTHSDD